MKQVEPGDIIQVTPQCQNQAFHGCLAVVDESKSFGCVAFVQALGTRDAPGGRAYIRLRFDEYEPVGAKAPHP